MDSFNTAFVIGNIGMTWNAIMLALGILVAVVVSEIIVKARKAYKDLALDACIVGIPAGLVGARLFAALSGKIAFSQFFDLTVGGLNLPGALLFAGVGVAIYARIKKLSLAEVFDILLPGAFFGLAVGRWSDFFLCEGLGPVVENVSQKFFPLATFTTQYFTDGETVAYAVFFLDFLVCLALGIAALLMKNRPRGTASRVTIILYLFAEFILEWLRDGSARQIVFGEVRFNQLPLLVLLLFFVGLSLYAAKRAAAEKAKAAEAPEEPEAAKEPEAAEEPEAEEKPAEAPEAPEAKEEPEAAEEPAEDGEGAEA